MSTRLWHTRAEPRLTWKVSLRWLHPGTSLSGYRSPQPLPHYHVKVETHTDGFFKQINVLILKNNYSITYWPFGSIISCHFSGSFIISCSKKSWSLAAKNWFKYRLILLSKSKIFFEKTSGESETSEAWHFYKCWQELWH